MNSCRRMFICLFLAIQVGAVSGKAEDKTLEPGGAQASTQLPREISGLELGQVFDSKDENVHVFGNADGSDSYVYHDGQHDRSINVDIDADQKITRLSWHFLIHDKPGRDAAEKDLRDKFGIFFKRREQTDDGEKLVFQDDQTYYTVTFEGHMITIVSCQLGAESCNP